MKKTTNEETIDDIDLKILQILQQDAKITIKELSEKVNLSPSPVFERQKRLERIGYIKGYYTAIDAQMCGNLLKIQCYIRLKHHDKENYTTFVNTIQDIPEVTECYNITGDYDFMMILQMKSMEHYQHFMTDTLGTMGCIGQLHSIFVISDIKHSHTVPIYKSSN